MTTSSPGKALKLAQALFDKGLDESTYAERKTVAVSLIKAIDRSRVMQGDANQRAELVAYYAKMAAWGHSPDLHRDQI